MFNFLIISLLRKKKTKMSKKLIYFLPLLCFLPLICCSPTTFTINQPEVTKDQVKLVVSYNFDLELNQNVTKWSQRNYYGDITVPWSAFGLEADKLGELMEAMAAMEREVNCMEFPYIPQETLNFTEWTHGVIFSWNDQSSCNSALGVQPGFGMNDFEVKYRDLNILAV